MYHSDGRNPRLGYFLPPARRYRSHVWDWVGESIDSTDVTLLVKIPSEDFTDETLAINDTYEDDVREIVVLVMEVDKVADEVTDVEIDK